MTEERWAEIRAIRESVRGQVDQRPPERPPGYAWHCSGDRGADLALLDQALLEEQRRRSGEIPGR